MKSLLKTLLCLTLLAASFAGAAERKSDIYKKLLTGIKPLLVQYKETAWKGKEGSPIIAVHDLDSVGEAVKKLDLGQGLAEMVSAQVAKADTNFSVVDRKRVKTLMKELAMSASGLVDEGSAKQMGRMLASDALLTGSVSQIGKMIQVKLALVDVETSKQMATTTVELPADELVPMAQAASLESKYPITAAFRSLSVPGWGHFYNDQPGWGVFYGVTTGAALGFAVYSTATFDQAKRDYNVINGENYNQFYPAALSPQQAADLAFKNAQNWETTRNTAWIVTGGLWVLNSLHAWIAAIAINNRIKQFSEASPAPKAAPVVFALPTYDGWRVAAAWQF